MNTSDENRSGRRKEIKVTIPEIVEKIHRIALKDRRLCLLEIAGLYTYI